MSGSWLTMCREVPRGEHYGLADVGARASQVDLEVREKSAVGDLIRFGGSGFSSADDRGWCVGTQPAAEGSH